MAPPQGRVVWGSPLVAGRPDTFRYIYRTRREAESYIREVGEAVVGSRVLNRMAHLAAITQVSRGTVPGVARSEATERRAAADPRWVRSMAGRRRVIAAADAAGMTPEGWVRGGGFVGRSNSPRWNLILDAIERSSQYAVFIARDYEVGPRGGMRVYGRVRRRAA